MMKGPLKVRVAMWIKWHPLWVRPRLPSFIITPGFVWRWAVGVVDRWHEERGGRKKGQIS